MLLVASKLSIVSSTSNDLNGINDLRGLSQSIEIQCYGIRQMVFFMVFHDPFSRHHIAALESGQDYHFHVAVYFGR